jgi:hypothetical protein
MRKLIVLAFLLFALPVWAVDIYVDGDASGGGTGVDWTNAYNTLAEAEDENRDLTSDAEDCHIYIRNKCDDTAEVTFAGWTTTGYHLYVEVPEAYRHTGSRGTGGRLEFSANNDHCLILEVPNMIINGLSMRNSHGNTYSGIYVNGAADSLTIANCLIADMSSAGTNGGVYVLSGAENVTINNTIFLSCNYGIRMAYAGNINACTMINSDSYGVYINDWQNVNLRNCYIGGSGTQDIDQAGTNGTINCTYCSVSDTSFADETFDTETDCDDSIACAVDSGAYFANVTAGSEDADVTSASSSLYTNPGADIDGEASWPTVCESGGDGIDYAGTVRSTWVRGAYEYESVAAAGQVIMITAY